MTTYNETARNTTEYDEVDGGGELQYLLTDDLSFILLGEDEDETLILREATEYAAGSRNATSFTSTPRN